MERYSVLALAVCLVSGPAVAVNVVVDYTYDSSGFFSTATANGQKARSTVEAAASFFSGILDDAFVRVEKPLNYTSTAPFSPPLTNSLNWLMQFDNPSTGAEVSISNPVIPADEYRLYVGARNLPDTTLGQAGPGGFEWSLSGGGYYSMSQLEDIQNISDDFDALLQNRSQSSGDFGGWGGQLAFDNAVSWNYDHTVPPSANQNDLYSVSLHEISHALGFGTSAEWNLQRSGTTFNGASATATNGGVHPTLDAEFGHWAQTTNSAVFEGGAAQQAAMTPKIQVGTRKLLTDLDAAALVDIGWQVISPPSVPGDFNTDGQVDAADYAVWRTGLGGQYSAADYQLWRGHFGQFLAPQAAGPASAPEPAAAILACLTLGALSGARRSTLTAQ